MPFSRNASSLPALLSLTVMLACAGCDPAPLPPQPEAPAAAADGLSGEKTVVCLFSDLRMPFQRAQAQFLSLLDANDAAFRLDILEARDAAGQRAQIQALADSPPAALLVQPAGLETVLPDLKALQAAGTRVFAFDLDAKPGNPFPGTALVCDPAEIGRAAAGIVQRALERRAAERGTAPAEGRVMVIRGSDDSPWCSRVHEAFASELARHPGIVLVHDAAADWNPALVGALYLDALRLQQSVDVVFAHDDFLAQAAHFAAELAGRREDTLILGVNGFEGDEGGLEMISRGEIDATVFRPYLVDYAWQMLSRPEAAPAASTMVFTPRPVLPADIDSPEGRPSPQSKPASLE